jgi:hypothetical protein
MGRQRKVPVNKEGSRRRKAGEGVLCTKAATILFRPWRKSFAKTATSTPKIQPSTTLTTSTTSHSKPTLPSLVRSVHHCNHARRYSPRCRRKTSPSAHESPSSEQDLKKEEKNHNPHNGLRKCDHGLHILQLFQDCLSEMRMLALPTQPRVTWC